MLLLVINNFFLRWKEHNLKLALLNFVSTLLCCIAALNSIYIYLSNFNNYEVGDFYQDYLAGLALIRGESIYGDFISSYARKNYNLDIYNFHPPFVSVLSTPFAFINIEYAAFAISLLSIILWWRIITELNEYFNVSKSYRMLILCLAFCWHPFAYLITNFQIAILVTFPVIASWFYLKHNKPFYSGVALAFATSVKLYPALFIFFLIRFKLWKILVSYFITLIFILFFTIVIVGVEDVKFYFLHVTSRNIHEWTTFPVNISIDGAIEKFFGNQEYFSPLIKDFEYRKLLTILCKSFVFIWYITGLNKLKSKRLISEAFGLTICLMLLLSPISWSYGLLATVLPLYIVANNSNIFISKINIASFIIIFTLGYLLLFSHAFFLTSALLTGVLALLWILFWTQQKPHLDIYDVIQCALLLGIPDIYLARMIIYGHSPEIAPTWGLIVLTLPTLGLFQLSKILVNTSKIDPANYLNQQKIH